MLRFGLPDNLIKWWIEWWFALDLFNRIDFKWKCSWLYFKTKNKQICLLNMDNTSYFIRSAFLHSLFLWLKHFTNTSLCPQESWDLGKCISCHPSYPSGFSRFCTPYRRLLQGHLGLPILFGDRQLPVLFAEGNVLSSPLLSLKFLLLSTLWVNIQYFQKMSLFYTLFLNNDIKRAPWRGMWNTILQHVSKSFQSSYSSRFLFLCQRRRLK